MYGTYTQTQTYTVVDIRKTFESFLADIRMIARRTGKWEQDYVEDIHHDILAFAEGKYLSQVDISLLDENDKAIQVARYIVSENGNSMTGDRAGGNNWPSLPNTKLSVIISYNNKWFSLSNEEKAEFKENHSLRIGWVSSSIDTRYLHLSSDSTKTYASKGYELNRTNFY